LGVRRLKARRVTFEEFEMPRWLIPTTYVVVSFVAAEIIPRLEYALFPAYGHALSVSSAQVLLGAVSSGMMAFTAIVFSIAFLVIQYTATAFSKRFILLLGRNTLIYHAFGIFVATFTFALGTLVFVNREDSDWIPVGSIVIVGLLMLLSVAMLARLINRLAELRITRVLQYIGDGGRAAIARMPAAGVAPANVRPLGEPGQVVMHRSGSVVLAAIDTSGLVRLARDAGGTIRLECAVGDPLYPGSVIARMYGARVTIAEAELLRLVRLAAENLFLGDVRFSLRLLVDAAIMALSPAVNDPTTAVEALDQIEDLMLTLGQRGLEAGRIADENGELRLIYPVPTWDDYLALAFDEIRQYGAESLQVVRRLRATLVHLAEALADERRDAVIEYRRRLDAKTEHHFEGADRATALGIDPQGLGLTRRADAST
jgi:uncharacterized membrane protein